MVIVTSVETDKVEQVCFIRGIDPIDKCFPVYETLKRDFGIPAHGTVF